MVLWGKNGQAAVSVPGNAATETEIESLDSSQSPIDLNQVEANMHQLAEKIRLEKEKNIHLVQVQKSKLESLQSELKNIELGRGSAIQHLESGNVNNSEERRELSKRIESINDQLFDKKREISRIELDIALLEQEKDEESIDSLLAEWGSYEKQMFSNYITPLYQEVVAAKQMYFEKMKQLRSKYTGLEKLAAQINSGLPDGEMVTVHTWSGATQNNPELLITKYDEQKEEAILNTYKAE